MILSPELFEQVTAGWSVEANPTPSDRSAANEQRGQPRLTVSQWATILPIHGASMKMPFEVTVRDLSAGGFGFIHGEKLPLGEETVVLLPLPGDGPLAVLCEIAYWQPLTNGSFCMGAKFTRVLRRGSGRGEGRPAAAVATAVPAA